MIKLSEIAVESGFSVPVVSRVLSPKPHKDARVAEATRKHIQDVARRMGYRPNRNAEFLKRGQSPVIGCFLPSRTDSLLAKLMKGIAEEGEANDFPLAFYFDMTKASYLEFLERSRRFKNCGIISYPYFKLDAEVEKVIADYQDNGGKIVLIEGSSERWQWRNCTSVSVDDYYGGVLAAQHLIERGARTFITKQYQGIPERIAGFTDTVQKTDATVAVKHDPAEIISEVIRLHPERKFPVGLYLPTDGDALTVLCELQRSGIEVGQDVLLIGYGNHYMTECVRPALTTVAQPFYKVGQTAVKKTIASIYADKPESIRIKPELIVRQSA